MKLRNKKTGEMGIINYFDNQSIVIYPIDENWNAKGDKKYVHHSLAELNEEWEDYEEPKEFWHILPNGGIINKTDNDNALRQEFIEDSKQIGNYFETKEEAEKAVKKLKAWKQLKDDGITFSLDEDGSKPFVQIHSKDATGTIQKVARIVENLYLLFGGEE